MRIADIIARYADRNTTVVDATSEASGLASYCDLPLSLGVSTVRIPTVPDPSAVSTERVLVILHLMEPDEDEQELDHVLSAYGKATQGVFLLKNADDIARYSLIERTTKARREVLSLHQTDHRRFRVALALGGMVQPDDIDTRRLRTINEYRCMSFKMRLCERELIDARGRIARVTKERESVKRELAVARKNHEIESEKLRRDLVGVTRDLASERAAQQGRTRELQSAIDAAEEATARSEELQQKLSFAYTRVVAARNSVSFRIGRATNKLIQGAWENPLRLPHRWVSVFRERSVVPRSADDSPRVIPKAPAVGELFDEERQELARQHWLLGREPLEGPPPGIAGIVGPRLAAELGNTTRFQPLEPSAWRYQLESEHPAFVLITACGLGAGGAWASCGTPAGRGRIEALVDLAEVCRAARTPLVYWDTVGSDLPRLGMPSAVRFDMVYSVSPSRCEGGSLDSAPARLLAPAVEPLVCNPIGVAARPPRSCLYAGGFDQRMGRSELEKLQALLTASADFGLEIHDPHWGYQGQLAVALQFPDELSARCRRRTPALKELHHMRQAGLVVCASQVAEGDFVPWELLRAIACGGYVLTTSTATDDTQLNAAVSVVRNTEAATAAGVALRERPRLDAAWQSAFAHILSEYAMRDRLRTIAIDVGAQGAVPGAPRVKVVSSETQLLSSMDATHLLAGNVGNGASAETLAELEGLARLSHAEVVAIAPGGGTEPMYSHSALPEDAITAVRIDALRTHCGGDGVWSESAIAELLVAGAQVFVKRDFAKIRDAGSGGDA